MRPETEAEQQEVMAAWGAWFGALGDATELAKGCPLVGSGGSVDVYEAIAM
jgi:hypothetical protein